MSIRQGARHMLPPSLSLMPMVHALKKHSVEIFNLLLIKELFLKGVFSSGGGVLTKTLLAARAEWPTLKPSRVSRADV
jgi:hypothetical protein